ncbi:MAG: DUF2283 domain-containing protein [Spirochaetia bacterium]|jgi:uncharacterized protein YuzE
MKIEYNKKADLLYLRLDARSQQVINQRVADDIVLDVGAEEKIVGIEILNASKNVDLAHLLPLQFERVD